MPSFEKDLSLCVLYDKYAPLLSDKKREVFELYFWDDLSLAEVAFHTKTTRQAVRDLIKHASDELLDFESALGLAEKAKRFTAALKLSETITREIHELPSGTEHYGEKIKARTSELLLALKSMADIYENTDSAEADSALSCNKDK